MNASLYLMFQNETIITIAFHSKIWHQLQVPCIETMKKLDLICQADIKKPRSVDLRSA